MKLNNYYFSFIYAMVLIFLPITFSAWTRQISPRKPEPGTKLSCKEWILFYRFRKTDTEYNSRLARLRDPAIDRDVFLWTASFVYILSRSEKNTVMPKHFCEKRGLSANKKLEFLALEDEQRTCKDWITFYGYDSSYLYNNMDSNAYKARIRNKSMDDHISIWAAGYAKLITRKEFNIMLPSTYCQKIGIDKTKLTRFMTYSTTLMSCEDWINLYDYTDDLHHNYSKALIDYDPILKLHMNHWVVGYITDLLDRGWNQNLLPATYCAMQRNGLEKSFYFSEDDVIEVANES